MTTTNFQAIANHIETEGSITLHGYQALALVREAIEHAVQAAGCRVVFLPDSAPDLVDYLTVTATSGLEGAVLGGGLGGLLGLLFDRPGTGAAIGASIGLLAGAARGLDRVEQGWRVRAIRELDGTPTVTIHGQATP